MVATKEQERKALEQIKKIVEGLGEDSYLSMAFDGCFADAEANINEDVGYSYKERYESALKEVERLRRIELNKNEEVRALNKRVDELSHKVYSEDDNRVIRMCVRETVQNYRKAEVDAREKMLEASLTEKDDELLLMAQKYRHSKKMADMVSRFENEGLK